MPTTLGERSSVSPLPVGRPTRHTVDSGGLLTMPAAGQYLPMSGGSAQLGPFNLPYRYWLCCVCNWLPYAGVSWQRYDIAIYLLINNSAYGADLNGLSYKHNADSAESSVGYSSQSIEAKFFCEASTMYHVRLIVQLQGANIAYYQHPTYANMNAYTIGEGVY